MKFKEEIVEQYLATLSRYAPNMNKDTILWRYLSTPIDIENKFLSMVEGSYKHGLYNPLQMGIFRPNETCSRHRTPIKNLYVAGSSCYPGGCVIWGAGYNAANAVAEDLGLEKLWVVYPGTKEYALDDSITVVPLSSIPRLAEDLRGS